MPGILQSRKPRYRRVPAVACRLQERDASIIQLVYKHRFLSSEHIGAMLGGSQQGILRRLHKLYHSGYLDRPPEQIRPYRQGSDPMVYGLGNRGADLLERDFGIPRGKVDWTSKNREVKTIFLEHTLMVSHFMVCLELACRSCQGVKLLGPDEIVKARRKPAGKFNPLSWPVQMKRLFGGREQSLSFGIVPDNVFGLHFPEEEEGRQFAFFFLEADRSTMPIRSTDLKRSSFFKKMLGYWESWRQGLFREVFGFKNARVLTITKSQARIDNMIEANREVDDRHKGSKLFYFAPAGAFSIEDPGRILQPVWRNGRDAGLSGLID